MIARPPPPPFTEESAHLKVRLAEDGWNGRDPAKVALAYTEDTLWRNRTTFVTSGADGLMAERLPASTTSPSPRPTACSTGPSAAPPDDHPGLSDLGL